MSASAIHAKGIWRRGQILDAAIKVFGERGFDQTKLTDIARECKIASQLIYRYFPDKDSIYKASVLTRIDAVIKATRDAVKNEPFPFLTGQYNRQVIPNVLADPLLSAFNRDATVGRVNWWLESDGALKNMADFSTETIFAQEVGVIRRDIDARAAAEATYRMGIWFMTPRLSDIDSLLRDLPHFEYVTLAALFVDFPDPRDPVAREEFAASVLRDLTTHAKAFDLGRGD